MFKLKGVLCIKKAYILLIYYGWNGTLLPRYSTVWYMTFGSVIFVSVYDMFIMQKFDKSQPQLCLITGKLTINSVILT